MKHDYSCIYENVRLRPLMGADTEPLRLWRNDAEKTKFLRPIGVITPEMQNKWFESYLEDENQIIFAIDEISELNRMVGSVALYDFHETTAEIGKIQIGDDKAHHRGIGRKALAMACKIGFDYLHLTKIIASVHQDNISSHSNFEKLGFQIVGTHPSVVGGTEDEFEILVNDFREKNTYQTEITVFEKP
ncbi:MAG: GNAT family N-acetyltransferase [Oscillospiraceae bacterium]